MRFIFITSDFHMGGVMSSMRNLCNDLVIRGHCVDILNLPSENALPEGFSQDIRLIQIDDRAKLWNLGIHTVKATKGIKKVFLLMLGLLKKIVNKGDLWHKFVFSKLMLPHNYDVAIGYRQSPVCYWLAANKCKAKVSIGFWHTDAQFESIESLEACIAYPDRIACVSDAVTRQMKSRFPKFANKFGTVYNLFNGEEIVKKSKESFPYHDDEETFIIVTVSRIENRSKRIDVIPSICLRLMKTSNRRFHWYIVGDGPDKAAVEEIIRDTKTQECITLVGAQRNPYPYMRCADLFVLCSKWESYGMVVVESLITGTPVVAADYPALHEILDDGKNGLITPNDPDAIAEAISGLLNNEDAYERLKSGARGFTYSSEYTYNQLIELMGK